MVVGIMSWAGEDGQQLDNASLSIGIRTWTFRYRISLLSNGEAIATGFVESTVNQVVSKRFCKKQQMQWSKRGAHLLLQTRVKTLNRELGSVCKHWYPDMEVEEIPDAAN